MIFGIIAIILIILAFIFLYLKIEELKKNESLKNLQEQVDRLRVEISQNLQNTTGQINLRLDKAAEFISTVSEKIGGLTETAKRVIELTEDIKKLEDLLKPPKLRGKIGETFLENLLKQILPSENYELQYRFKSGIQVDAVIKIGEYLCPVDAKFPLESFNKMLEAKDEKEHDYYKKNFVRACKEHIDKITKYILPNEKTFDFALMYIPAENVYYETIINDEIFNHSLQKKVIPVSPNTFYLYLMVIAYGLKGLKIEEKAKMIISGLTNIKNITSEIRDTFNTARKQLNDSAKNLDIVDKKLSQLEIEISALLK